MSKNYVNVKIPEEYVKLIDKHLKTGGTLNRAGFKGRAEFVRNAVKEKLRSLGVLAEPILLGG